MPANPTRQPTAWNPEPNQVRYPKQRGLDQAYQLRDLAAHAVIALKERPIDAQSATTIARLISAWDTARQAIRVYRGQGNPKPVEASNGRRKRKQSQAGTPPPPASE